MYIISGRITKKGKGSFLWSKERGKGSFPFLAELSTGGGRDANGTKIPSKYAANFNALENLY
jgi:hypothetical protein